MKKEIIDLIKKHNHKTKNYEFSMESNLKNDINLDSLTIMKILIDLENKFNIIFEPNDFDEIITLGDLVTFIKTKVSKSS